MENQLAVEKNVPDNFKVKEKRKIKAAEMENTCHLMWRYSTRAVPKVTSNNFL